MRWNATTLACSIVVVMVMAWIPDNTHAQYRPDYPEDASLAQPYCQDTRYAGCCPGRNDDCIVPILDTICYCDQFCNRTITDCCPDFWGYCMGTTAPPGSMRPNVPYPEFTPHLPVSKPEDVINNCVHYDRIYVLGDVVKMNCNNCTCEMAMIKPEYNWKCTQKICLVREELMTHVNSGDFGWRATNYSFLWGLTLDEGVQFRLGTKRPMQPVKQMTSLRVHINEVLPPMFDGREEWDDLIHPIMDQGNCGSSWAFSTSSVAADRLSLHSDGKLYDMFSPQNLISCNKDHMQKGCDGGHLDRAWWFLRKVGVVSDDCYPYRSGEMEKTGLCMVPRFKMLSSKVKCPSSKRESSPVYQTSPPYRIAPSEKEIMKEILENGPVQATMEVKEDFFMYKGGVFRSSLPANFLPPNHRKTGFHSVKILGWGTERVNGKDLKYWLCANSWGAKWGEDGYFRILRGADECKIESFIVGVWAKVNGRPVVNPIPTRHQREGSRKRRAARPQEEESRKRRSVLIDTGQHQLS